MRRLLLSVLAVNACSTTPPVVPTETPGHASADDFDFVLVRAPAYGDRQGYAVRVSESGSVLFEEWDGDDVVSTKRKLVPRSTVQELLRTAERLRPALSAACESVRRSETSTTVLFREEDQPFFSLQIRGIDPAWERDIDLGCPNERLTRAAVDLEDEMVELLELCGWVSAPRSGACAHPTAERR